jgi:protein ImuA
VYARYVFEWTFEFTLASITQKTIHKYTFFVLVIWSPKSMLTVVAAASPLSQMPSLQMPIPQKSDTQKLDTQALAKQIRAIETAGRGGYSLGVTGKGTISSGCSVLDNSLPGGGYSLGTIVEWVDDHQRGGERSAGGFGNGSLYLALTAARYAMQESNKYVVVIDSEESFYPPAALYMGLALDRIIVLRPPNYDDAMWAIDQSLRSSAVAAVVARLDKLSDLNARRFQLAAEQNGALGLFLRPASARSQPSWSEVQWGMCNQHTNPMSSQGTEPRSLAQGRVRRIHLESLRMRGGRSGQHWMLMIDTQSGTITGRKLVERTVERNNVAASTSSMRLASQLAMPTSPRPASTNQPAKRNRAS